MRKNQSFLSIFVLIVFALTSVMQFHHHDCYGNICIHLTTLDDLVLGQSNDIIEFCNHDVKHDSHHNHHHHEDTSCSMHLGCYKASEQNIIKVIIAPLQLYGLLHLNQIIIENKIVDIIVNVATYYDDYINNVIKSLSAFRAPPIKN